MKEEEVITPLIIDYTTKGKWCARYFTLPRHYKTLNYDRVGHKDPYWNIGTIVDNRTKWRKKLDSITQNAEYDIIVTKPDIGVFQL